IVHNPQIQTALVTDVLANATDIDWIGPRTLRHCHRVAASTTLIDHNDTRRYREELSRLAFRQFALRFDVHRLGMPEINAYPHRDGIHADRIILEDLPGLPEHLHFFFRVAVVEEDIDLRHTIECDLFGNVLRLDAPAV